MIKFIVSICFLLTFQLAFAQEVQDTLVAQVQVAQNEPKISVYVTGDIGTNEKMALSTKILSSFANSGKYKTIDDSDAFFNTLQEDEKINTLENSKIIAFSKQMGVQFACLININPVFDSYHVSARIIDTETSEVVIMGETNSTLKSLEDLTNITNELSVQLLQLPETTPDTALVAPTPQQCDKKYNINELLAQIQYGFPTQLKDCGTSFAKNLALSKMPFSKTPTPEPKSFMIQCTIDGIKGNLSGGFPGVDKVVGDLQDFINNILNLAMAGASLDPSKLMSAIGNMKIDELLSSIKNFSTGNACIVSEPYEYVAPVKEDKMEGGGDSGGKKDNGFFTFGVRTGVNLSYLYASYYNPNRQFIEGTYESTLGFQAGLVFDFALGETFHIQPGLMYVLKGAKDSRPVTEVIYTYHYIEIPLLISLKSSSLRVNAGPYIAFSLAGDPGVTRDGVSSRDTYFYNSDIGINIGLGFDIDWFYIGLFYDYGLADIDKGRYNRTLGLNFGVNL